MSVVVVVVAVVVVLVVVLAVLVLVLVLLVLLVVVLVVVLLLVVLVVVLLVPPAKGVSGLDRTFMLRLISPPPFGGRVYPSPYPLPWSLSGPVTSATFHFFHRRWFQEGLLEVLTSSLIASSNLL